MEKKHHIPTSYEDFMVAQSWAKILQNTEKKKHQKN